VNQVAGNVLQLVRRLFGKEIQLVQQLAPAVGKVRGDAGQIESVLLNLVLDARDALAQGGQLTVATANIELDAAPPAWPIPVPPGPYVQVAVQETGGGLGRWTPGRLLAPFFPAEEPGNGTGRGLSRIGTILRRHQGTIQVVRTPGQGTT